MAEETSQNKPALTPDEVIAAQRTRQLTIMAVVLLLLAGAIAAHRFGSGEPEKKTGSVALAGFKAGDVAAIEIFSGQGGEKVRLARDGETWRLANRFGALAEKDDVAGLVKKITEAKRLDRAATQESERFALFELTFEQAAHVVMTDKQGKELLHLLVGKGDNSSADFVRYSGKDAVPGVFELVDTAGVMETLRSRLHLDAEGKAEVRPWLDMTAFKTLARETEVSRVVISDKGANIELESAPDPRDAGKRIWNVVKPEPGYGNTATIDGVLDALRTMRGSDIAGKPDVHGAELGVVGAERWVEVKYSLKGGKAESLRFDFGKVKDKEVPVWISSQQQGEFIWLVSDYALTRIFRPTADFVDVAPLPPPGPAVTERAVVQFIVIGWDGTKASLRVSRTKAEARKLVQVLLERASTAGVNWADLEKENSEFPYKTSDGVPVEKDDIRWPRDFPPCGLSLKIGEVGLFETEMGYTIIKRLE